MRIASATSLICIALAACATQADMRESGPVHRERVSMSVTEARDCVTDHWSGGLYGRSVTPYRDGFRIRNSGGHVYAFVEVQPAPDGGAEIAAYGRPARYAVSVVKRCAGRR